MTQACTDADAVRGGTGETLEIAEIFSSVQGEGPSAGEPALFVRLALCNLRCTWCDTKYTWDFRTYRYEDEVRTISLAALRKRIVDAPERRVILTGGEPLVQQRALGALVTSLPFDVWVEVETNGTVVPDAPLLARVNQWNVSPKLAHSGEPEHRRVRLDALRALLTTDRATLKLVVGGEMDMAEVTALVAACAWPADRVMLMPQATNRADYMARADGVQALARRGGYRFSPRLHVIQWDGERGR